MKKMGAQNGENSASEKQADQLFIAQGGLGDRVARRDRLARSGRDATTLELTTRGPASPRIAGFKRKSKDFAACAERVGQPLPITRPATVRSPASRRSFYNVGAFGAIGHADTKFPACAGRPVGHDPSSRWRRATPQGIPKKPEKSGHQFGFDNKDHAPGSES